MNKVFNIRSLIGVIALLFSITGWAQGDNSASARLDSRQIVVGDQAKLFLVATNNPNNSKLDWPLIPDKLDSLEVVEKGKIDTTINGNVYTYRQKLLITGFDSGVFKVPSFTFTITPNGQQPMVLTTDSFMLMVQTVAVDTTKAFKPIKNIVYVKSSWLDYIWYIIGGLIFIAFLVFVIVYFITNKKEKVLKPSGPQESLNDKTMRLLRELEAKELWQKDNEKAYYIELTDIVRSYIEARFHTPALELTTDEFLAKAKYHRDLQPYLGQLTMILQTADLAKFAKAKPLPQEHFDAMEHAKKFVDSSRPVIIVEPKNDKTV